MNNKHVFTESQVAWLFMAPALIIIVSVVGYPIIKAIVISFQSYNLKRPDNIGFNGLKNYISIFTDISFWKTLYTTLNFMVFSLFFEFLIGVGLAVALTKLSHRKILQALIIIPWAIPVTVNGIMWKWIFNPSYGSFNALLTQLGILETYKVWLGEPTSAMIILIFTDVWKSVPLVTFMTIAALQTIPPFLYEVAYLDGAKARQVFWKITLPMILPLVMVTLILKTVDAFKVFDLVYVLTKGGPSDATKTIAYYAYEQTFSFLNFGKGAGLAIIMTVIIGLLSKIYYKFMNGDEY